MEEHIERKEAEDWIAIRSRGRLKYIAEWAAVVGVLPIASIFPLVYWSAGGGAALSEMLRSGTLFLLPAGIASGILSWMRSEELFAKWRKEAPRQDIESPPLIEGRSATIRSARIGSIVLGMAGSILAGMLLATVVDHVLHRADHSHEFVFFKNYWDGKNLSGEPTTEQHYRIRTVGDDRSPAMASMNVDR